jgi:hypothetical protein
VLSQNKRFWDLSTRRGRAGRKKVLSTWKPCNDRSSSNRSEASPGHQLRNHWAKLYTMLGGREQEGNLRLARLADSRRPHFVALSVRMPALSTYITCSLSGSICQPPRVNAESDSAYAMEVRLEGTNYGFENCGRSPYRSAY